MWQNLKFKHMKNPANESTPIFVVSGGKGVTGHIIVQTLIIQYPENRLFLFLGSSSGTDFYFYQPMKKEIKSILKIIENEIKD